MANMWMQIFVCALAMSRTVAEPENHGQRPAMPAYPLKSGYVKPIQKINYDSKITAQFMLWSNIIYGHHIYGVFFYQKSSDLQRPYGARKHLTTKSHFRHGTAPRVVYDLKFHGGRMVFCRIKQGKVTTVPGRRYHTSNGHRTICLKF